VAVAASAGTVDHVDGNTVYLKMRDGSHTKVTVSGDTKVQIPKSERGRPHAGRWS